MGDRTWPDACSYAFDLLTVLGKLVESIDTHLLQMVLNSGFAARALVAIVTGILHEPHIEEGGAEP